MKLTPPTKKVFWLSTVISVLGVLLSFLSATSGFAIWVLLIGNVLLWLSVALKGF